MSGEIGTNNGLVELLEKMCNGTSHHTAWVTYKVELQLRRSCYKGELMDIRKRIQDSALQ